LVLYRLGDRLWGIGIREELFLLLMGYKYYN